MVTLVRPFKATEANRSCSPSLDSVSDIGKRINKQRVLLKHFVQYERFVVSAIESFLMDTAGPIRMESIENARSAFTDSRQLESKFNLDRILIKKIPSNSNDLSLAELSDVVRLIVRECMWARLQSGKRVVHFGWDSYIYFAGTTLNESYINEFRSIGRVVEKVDHLPTIEST